MPYLSPTTLTQTEQRAILRTTAKQPREVARRNSGRQYRFA